ncbi:MAG: hypothetical protein CO094_01755 [Anaerolineae bacterium CG_4_9_14_3_um_filter_57_17]|nr:MAG: hypothetical protein AUK01_09305 [Anaerolineae bacterium CG2_30_57_67]PJB68229.1 MAG: hypothetical protein CO094_01755 [Anaerolineae bacterium CG_4_9_14_3_um_filter_57_17]
MKKMICLSRRLLLIVLLFGLSACSARRTDAPRLDSPSNLTPFLPGLTPSRNAPTLRAPTLVSVLPSATPFAHVLMAGETISALAERYSVSVDEILTVNPGLQPQVLPVGQVILIPAPSVASQQALPTPVSLPVSPVRCSPQPGGVWCFALVSNPSAETIALLTGQMRLLDSTGQTIQTQAALALLDNLPPGAALPLAAFFSPMPTGVYGAEMRIITALRLPVQAAPLAPVVRNLFTQVDFRGRSASVAGYVFLPENATAANQIWLAAVGYDRDGELAAFRRVELLTAPAPGQALPFSLKLYSLGNALWRVEVFAEAH